ncbi:nucleotidyltransferase domain-containing protein [Solibacillus sp. FSL W8-0372]|uniref:nucleotidyltransferase domain-containing protein n=1 Tax=Solibacillus sp. FSL W8-0372 TaxID=2921713 RepID=UPI0030D161FA
MHLEEVVQVLLASLKGNPLVKAVFLKGSIARNEHDSFSDIDLYCLVEEDDVTGFLPHRLEHLKAYKELIFRDDIFIVAPQILGVYEDFIHIDFYTVTPKTLNEKDHIKILYDPEHYLSDYEPSLQASPAQFIDAVDDSIWFLYQYNQSAKRGNDLWCCHLLHLSFGNIGTILLHHYCPEKAILGLKTLESAIPGDKAVQMHNIMNHIGVNTHKEAAQYMCHLLEQEKEWIFSKLKEPERILKFWERVMQII